MNKDAPQDRNAVLQVRDLKIAYETRQGDVEAVRGVSFAVRAGETLGLVGESGCGKSTVAYGLVNFLGRNGKIVHGSVLFQGQELVGRSERELKRLRGNRIAMVYQDPMQALNPSVRVGEQLAEVLTCHQALPWSEARDRSVAMLGRVNMPDPGEMMLRYPHQLSGGQQQRVVIAMALLNNPALLIMDEPTTALDVTVEAAVLDLITELKSEFQAAILFITHNLGVVARVSDQVCVMYAGEQVEQGPVQDIFHSPRHPYTMGLLASIPRLGDSKNNSWLMPIRGRIPPPAQRPGNVCVFAPRCDHAAPECTSGRPELREIDPGHVVRCVFAEDIAQQRRISQKPGMEGDFLAKGILQGDVLSADGIRIYYPQQSNSLVSLFGLGEQKFVKAVDDVSLRVAKGRTLGIVGESGCGKSTLVKGLIGLEPITGGEVHFLGLDATHQVSRRDTNLIREMQMVFQNPDSTLNPSFSVGWQIARPLKRFRTVPRHRIKEEVIRLLRAVRLDQSYYQRLPRQLSGGEKQRVGIARALASRPDLVICDEPVSALDVSVQAAVINLLLEIQQAFGSAMIFIAHDLSVVRFFSDDIAVMYLGQIVESGAAETIYAPPSHPYTEALLSAVPVPDPDAEPNSIRLIGNVPSALDPPSGCRFHTRCPRRVVLPENGRVCEHEVPPWRENGSGHRILCHIPLEELAALQRGEQKTGA
ncbi:dipeptide ABC transporter ATP-binding protein [Desulfonatronum parangueonense]